MFLYTFAMDHFKRAGLKSGLARQTPKLIADKAKAIQMHLAGADTAYIGRALGCQCTEARRWLIAAGCYRTLGRGKAVAGRRRYDAIRLQADELASDTRKAATMDDCKHWRRHPAYRARHYKGSTEANRASSRAWSKSNWRKRRLQIVLSNRIRSALRKQTSRKAGKTAALLGCTIAELREHLQSQFKPGMTWANHGRNGWHIDHKRPCSGFNLAIPEQQAECFNWRNLQPLWEAENIRKSDS